MGIGDIGARNYDARHQHLHPRRAELPALIGKYSLERDLSREDLITDDHGQSTDEDERLASKKVSKAGKCGMMGHGTPFHRETCGTTGSRLSGKRGHRPCSTGKNSNQR